MKHKRFILSFSVLSILTIAAIVAAFAYLGPVAGIVLALVAVAGLAYVFWNWRVEALYFPTTSGTVDRILELAALKPGDRFFDLGCGDGRLLFAAARKHEANGVGYEIDPVRVLLVRIAAITQGLSKRVSVVRSDVRKADLRDADVVFLYLNPDLNRELAPKLMRELKPGARVISNYNEMPGWRPVATRASERPGELVHLYVPNPEA